MPLEFWIWLWKFVLIAGVVLFAAGNTTNNTCVGAAQNPLSSLDHRTKRWGSKSNSRIE